MMVLVQKISPSGKDPGPVFDPTKELLFERLIAPCHDDSRVNLY